MEYPKFPTDQESIYQRLLDFSPRKYDQTHHHLDGQVSLLSPYITHGFLTLPMIKSALVARFGEKEGYGFMFDLAMREYFQRIFWRYGEKALWNAFEAKKTTVEYEKFMPENIIKGVTGIKILDQQLGSLCEVGYMHKKARQWFASYLTHYTATDWKLGAKLFFYHLLDGDLAANNLSWQGVTGTFSDKPFLFNQEGINSYVEEQYREEGNVIDDSLENLQERFLVQHRFLLTDNLRLPLELKSHFEEIENELSSEEQIINEMNNCNEVIYIHEWMINEFQIAEFDQDHHCYRLMVIDKDFWTKNPASAKRFRFMVELAKNIPNVRIYLGNPVELFKKIALRRGEERGALKIYSREYFSDRIKQVFTSLYCARKVDLEVWPYDWMFPNLTVVANRFSKFFALVERSL